MEWFQRRVAGPRGLCRFQCWKLKSVCRTFWPTSEVLIDRGRMDDCRWIFERILSRGSRVLLPFCVLLARSTNNILHEPTASPCQHDVDHGSRLSFGLIAVVNLQRIPIPINHFLVET